MDRISIFVCQRSGENANSQVDAGVLPAHLHRLLHCSEPLRAELLLVVLLLVTGTKIQRPSKPWHGKA